ncbi:hypothetical protein [Rhizobium sp. CC-YZS058]|uniref:hypothetical protein n=1 Tax=Rhizobium sp. CC-YZS058 TaxID=3042153 RepID=UPI002B05A252|nr:hypothetical protein [Rhizobium sp. CC-YZS058]MEA3536222.1 hypothetical protein [Rhizobium sp. CC-YZS058]
MIGQGTPGLGAPKTADDKDMLCLPDPTPAVAFALQRLGWHTLAAEKALADAKAEEAALAARPAI